MSRTVLPQEVACAVTRVTILTRGLRRLGLGLTAAGLMTLAYHAVAVRSFLFADRSTLPPPAGSFLPGAARFSFAVMGDSHGRTAAVDKIFGDIHGRDTDFVICVGDMARDMSAGHFDWLLDELTEVLGELPFYAVPGNHDIEISGLGAQGDPGRFYDRVFGLRHYWFSYGDTLFLGLDNASGELGKDQLTWADAVLQRMRPSFRTCVLFMHRPPLAFADGGGSDSDTSARTVSQPADYAPVSRLVEAYNINVVLCGHLHQYLEGHLAGARVIVVPPAGGKLRGNTSKGGYVLCSVDNDSQKIKARVVPVTDSYGGIERIEFVASGGFLVATWVPWLAMGSLGFGVFLIWRSGLRFE